MKLSMAQVVQTIKPTQFKKFKNQDTNIDHLPGTVRVRTTNGEVWASPADPSLVSVPLYGEQVLMLTAPSGQTEDSKKDKYFYIQIVNTHGLINNSILPFLQDNTTKGGNYASDSISVINPGKPPEQLSFEEKEVYNTSRSIWVIFKIFKHYIKYWRL